MVCKDAAKWDEMRERQLVRRMFPDHVCLVTNPISRGIGPEACDIPASLLEDHEVPLLFNVNGLTLRSHPPKGTSVGFSVPLC